MSSHQTFNETNIAKQFTCTRNNISLYTTAGYVVMASNMLTKRETSNYLVYIGQISDSKTRLIV